jgi:hypothetical protein
MSNKFGHFEKLKFPALSKLLGDGVASHEGEKWVKHRRILNPAFHLEKLKVRNFSDRLVSSVVYFVTHVAFCYPQQMLPAFSACCEDMVGRWVESLRSDGSFELDAWIFGPSCRP